MHPYATPNDIHRKVEFQIAPENIESAKKYAWNTNTHLTNTDSLKISLELKNKYKCKKINKLPPKIPVAIKLSKSKLWG
jgi:predicted PP-loop superfamily ATPase